MKKLVVDAENFESLLRAISCMDHSPENCGKCEDRHTCMVIYENIDTPEGMEEARRYLDVKPLTSVQERAGDEEEWRVVRRDRLKAILPGTDHIERIIEDLTTPQEKESKGYYANQLCPKCQRCMPIGGPCGHCGWSAMEIEKGGEKDE